MMLPNGDKFGPTVPLLQGVPTAWLGAVQLLCLSAVSAGKDALVVPLLAK